MSGFHWQKDQEKITSCWEESWAWTTRNGKEVELAMRLTATLTQFRDRGKSSYYIHHRALLLSAV